MAEESFKDGCFCEGDHVVETSLGRVCLHCPWRKLRKGSSEVLGVVPRISTPSTQPPVLPKIVSVDLRPRVEDFRDHDLPHREIV